MFWIFDYLWILQSRTFRMPNDKMQEYLDINLILETSFALRNGILWKSLIQLIYINISTFMSVCPAAGSRSVPRSKGTALVYHTANLSTANLSTANISTANFSTAFLSNSEFFNSIFVQQPIFQQLTFQQLLSRGVVESSK